MSPTLEKCSDVALPKFSFLNQYKQKVVKLEEGILGTKAGWRKELVLIHPKAKKLLIHARCFFLEQLQSGALWNGRRKCQVRWAVRCMSPVPHQSPRDARKPSEETSDHLCFTTLELDTVPGGPEAELNLLLILWLSWSQVCFKKPGSFGVGFCSWITHKTNVPMPGLKHLKSQPVSLSQLWGTGACRIHSLWGALKHQPLELSKCISEICYQC